MRSTTITFIVAVAENGVIGRNVDLPWHLRTDLKRFKTLTWGKPMIMGRKTWISIGKALPGRETIVVTRDPDFTAEGAHVVHSVEAAMERAQAFAVALNADEITVVGGGDIFRQLMPIADRIHLTLVHAQPEGDAFFPLPDDTEWIEESRAHHEPGEGDDHAFDFVVYARRSAADMS